MSAPSAPIIVNILIPSCAPLEILILRFVFGCMGIALVCPYGGMGQLSGCRLKSMSGPCCWGLGRRCTGGTMLALV